MHQTGFAAAQDTELYYEIQGLPDGQPLLFLHGNGESVRIFDKMTPYFTSRYRVIAMDTRGHGKSGRGNKPLNFETIAGDILCLLDALQLEAVSLLGFSDGGNAAITLSIAYTERVKSLILVGSNLSAKGIRPAVQWPIVLGYGVCSLFVPFSQKARRNWEILGLMVHHPDLRPIQLKGISCPALVVAGEKDVVKESETRAIAAAMPHSRLEIVPGAGHDLPGKYPGVLAKLALQFLEEHLFADKPDRDKV